MAMLEAPVQLAMVACGAISPICFRNLLAWPA